MAASSTLATNNLVNFDGIEKVVVGGDLAALSPEQRLSYYSAVCQSVGLNPLTKPFDYLKLSGRLVLYARKDATDQLRKIHGVSIEITDRDRVDDVYVVTAIARMPDGRVDSEIGAVNVANLKGEALANALMKATTKAKRRVTLSICGMGMLDETETETIPQQQRQFVEVDHETGEIVDQPEPPATPIREKSNGRLPDKFAARLKELADAANVTGDEMNEYVYLHYQKGGYGYLTVEEAADYAEYLKGLTNDLAGETVDV